MQTAALVSLLGPASLASAQQVASTGAGQPPPAPPGNGPLLPQLPAQADTCVDPGFTQCGTMCVDTGADPDHCGACDNACGSGQRCDAGACVSSWDIHFGLEPELDVAWASNVTGDSTPWASSIRYCEDGTSFSCRSLTLGGGDSPFSGGARLAAGLSLRFKDVALGVRGHYTAYQTDANSYREDVLAEAGGFDLHLRLYFGSTRFGEPQMHFFLEPALSYRRFGLTLGNQATSSQRTIAWDLFGPALRAGVDVAIFDRLRVGVYAGIDVLAATGIGATPAPMAAIPASTEFELGWEVGLSVRYTLPFAVNPQTAPAPSEPPPPRPEPVYVLVASESAAGAERIRPDFTETPTYLSNRTAFQTVAVLAPDRCADQTLSQATGQGHGSGEVLATQCGVEMAEIERALTRAGYRVISWRTMQRGEGLPRERARSLGAQVLFQVNSLERAEDLPYLRRFARERRFYMSNEYGHQGAPVPLLGADADELEQAINAREAQIGEGGRRPGVGIDVSAVSVSTGETIWLYQSRKPVLGSGAGGVRLLMRGEPVVVRDANGEYRIPSPVESRVWRWSEVSPRTDAVVATPTLDVRYGSQQSAEVRSGYTNDLQEVLFQQLRCVVNEAVQRFRCGEEDAAPICTQLIRDACPDVGGAQ